MYDIVYHRNWILYEIFMRNYVKLHFSFKKHVFKKIFPTLITDDMETDEAVDKETTKSEEKRESERDRSSSSGKNGKDSDAGTPKIKEEKMETTEIKQEDEESKSADSAIINGSQDENTNDGDMEDVSSVFVWCD